MSLVSAPTVTSDIPGRAVISVPSAAVAKVGRSPVSRLRIGAHAPIRFGNEGRYQQQDNENDGGNSGHCEPDRHGTSGRRNLAMKMGSQS